MNKYKRVAGCGVEKGMPMSFKTTMDSLIEDLVKELAKSIDIDVLKIDNDLLRHILGYENTANSREVGFFLDSDERLLSQRVYEFKLSIEDLIKDPEVVCNALKLNKDVFIAGLEKIVDHINSVSAITSRYLDDRLQDISFDWSLVTELTLRNPTESQLMQLQQKIDMSHIKFLNMKEGSWETPETLGDVNIKKTQLAIFPSNKKHGGLHINKADFTFNWRNKFIHNPTIGGHPAFSVSNIEEFIAKLKKYKIPFTDAKIYAMPDIYQVYLYDPNANVIEINQAIE